MSDISPELLGAKCHLCPLQKCGAAGPVLPETHEHAWMAVVGDYPEDREIVEGRPFTGQDSHALTRALAQAGVKREAVHWTTAVLCQPPANDMKKLLAKIQSRNSEIKKENTTRAKENLPPLPLELTPQECCRPRLAAELQGFRNVITLGGTACKAVTGATASILDLRGGTMHGPLLWDSERNTLRLLKNDSIHEDADPNAIKLLPTVSTSFIRFAKKWTQPFITDIGRAVRWFQGNLNWTPPEIVYQPDVETVREFLQQEYLAYDLETDGIEPTVAKIRCIGIGNSKKVMMIGFLSKDHVTRFYDPMTELRMLAVVRDWFVDEKSVKVGHNCLHIGTPVILGNGESEAIESLVRRKYDGTVKALNDKGEIVEARVTNWFRQRVPGQKWLVIRRKGEKKHARGLTLTPDHEVFTPRGRVRADQLVVGDKILVEERKLHPDERDALLGSLLGDSVASCKTSAPSGVKGKPRPVVVPIEQATSAIFRGSHTTKELTDEKNKWLGGLLNTWEETSNGFGQETLHHCYRTFAMRQVQEVAALVYRDGKPRLNAKVLDQLGPVGFAWMFADDGFKHTRRDRYDEPVLIATCGFPKEDREEACAWFCEKFGYTSLTLNGSLSLSLAATEKFVRMIAPYLLPAARYKLPKNKDWPEFVGFPERKAIPLAVEIESIEEYHPPTDTTNHRSNAETRWCLQTAEGNFLTGFGFVKNSGSYDRTVVRHQWRQMARDIAETLHDSPECLSEALTLFPDIFEDLEYPKGIVDPWPNLDTILLHRLVASELPHRLGFVGSVYTDAPSWKTDREGRKLAYDAENDQQLHEYCLPADATVQTEDGFRLIGDLVLERYSGKIASVSPQGKIEYKVVVNWIYTKKKSNWLRIVVGTEPYNSTRFDLVCTDDHRVFTYGGPKEAKDILVGDVVFTAGTYATTIPLTAKVWSVEPVVFAEGDPRNEDRFCLTVADNHNFFANGVLVANCGLDTSQTFTIMPQLWDAVHVKDQQELIVNDHEIQELCVHMHEVGMFVDQEKRAKVEQKKTLELVKYKEQLREFSGLPLLNPGSIHQLRKLLFQDWKLQPVLDEKLKYTLAGDPSTSDDAIRACLAIPRLREDQKGFLKTIRNYRSAQKELGTYIAKLRPRSESIEGIGWDVDSLIDENSIASEGKKSFIELSDELFADKEYGRKGITWKDGRMRPGYNASVAVTGRLSSSKPLNAQNFPKHLRALIRAQKGHILVGADADQLELRIAASRWKCPLYLNAFEADADPHSMTAIACFGDQFINADGWPEGDKIYTGGLWVPRNGAKFKSGSQAEKFRKLAKIVQYLSQYGGSPEAGLNALQQTEDENGELIYLLFQLRQYRMMHEAWLKGAKEFPIGWQREMAFFRKHGYSQEHVMGRKRDHLDGEDMNEIVNFGIQGASASLMNRAMRKIQNEIPLHKWGHGTGIITMTHDALVVECPDDGVTLEEIKGKKVYVAKPGSIAAWVSEVIEDAMNQTDPSLPGVKFTAAADIAMTWDKVG